MERTSLQYLPKKIAFGHMSYQAYHLGPQPVLELFAAGLKVGEIVLEKERKAQLLRKQLRRLLIVVSDKISRRIYEF